MYYKHSSCISLRQRQEPKRQIAAAGGVAYKEISEVDMREVSKEAVLLLNSGELTEENAKGWMQQKLRDRFAM